MMMAKIEQPNLKKNNLTIDDFTYCLLGTMRQKILGNSTAGQTGQETNRC